LPGALGGLAQDAVLLFFLVEQTTKTQRNPFNRRLAFGTWQLANPQIQDPYQNSFVASGLRMSRLIANGQAQSAYCHFTHDRRSSAAMFAPSVYVSSFASYR
jgi:hypothetical protein